MVDVETGKPVDIGQLGEYCIKGPQQMLGYLNNQEATDDMVDKDGWLHTGTATFEEHMKCCSAEKSFVMPLENNYNDEILLSLKENHLAAFKDA